VWRCGDAGAWATACMCCSKLCLAQPNSTDQQTYRSVAGARRRGCAPGDGRSRITAMSGEGHDPLGLSTSLTAGKYGWHGAAQAAKRQRRQRLRPPFVTARRPEAAVPRPCNPAGAAVRHEVQEKLSAPRTSLKVGHGHAQRRTLCRRCSVTGAAVVKPCSLHNPCARWLSIPIAFRARVSRHMRGQRLGAAAHSWFRATTTTPQHGPA
jgi:hypothetical protein